MRVVNLIACYNEKEIIGKMIEYLDDLAKKLPQYELITLVVDSHSPDGTGVVVKKMMKTRKNLHLLETPRGLGISLIQGFKYAMKELKADVVIPNDADFQWHPKYIPEMLAKIEEGYDVVVPSRHVPGGKDNFDLFRKLIHFVSNTLINHYYAGIREVKDLAGNFKAIRVKGVLEKVNFNRLEVKGFVIQATMIYELSKTGAKFCEIPAVYGERRGGKTKVGINLQFIKDVIETIINATKIRLERSQQFFKFAIVGFIGYLVNAIGLEVLYRAGMAPGPATALATELAIINNFILNNIWTFAEKKIVSIKMLPYKFVQFNLTSLGALIIQTVVVWVGTAFLGDQWRQFLLIFAIGFLVLPYNFFMYTTFIWKTRQSKIFGWLQKRLG
jgi:dolichol-phosphate mannosyltransferase